MLLQLLSVLVLASASDLARDLAEAIDLPSAKERAERAAKLADRPEISLEDWLGAMRAFGEFGRPSGDRGFVHQPLRVLDAVEPTNLHVFVPESYQPEQPAPLILALHETQDGGEQMVQQWIDEARALGALILAPTEPIARDGCTFTPRERENVLAALRWMRRKFHVDENRVVLTGVGRGAQLAWDLALRRPDRFAALAPMLGGPRVALASPQDNLRLLENVAALPIRDLQGAQDDAALVDTLHLAFARLEKFGARDAKLIEFPERAASFDFAAVDWRGWIGSARREAVPERVVCCAASAGEARNAWVEITGVEKEIVEDVTRLLPGLNWKSLDASAQRARTLRELEKHTARLELVRTEPGRFGAKSSGVTSFRLLLTREMLGPNGLVEVRWKARTFARTAIADERVLLAEFVERFDPSFLPVAELCFP